MPPERLFRDDAGAALERVARLEEENAALRAEVERLERRAEGTVRTPVRLPNRSPSPWAILGMAAAPAFVGLLLIAVSVTSPPPAPQIVEALPPRAPRVAKIPVEARQDPRPNQLSPFAKSECSPPYFYDARGVKHYKAACLR